MGEILHNILTRYGCLISREESIVAVTKAYTESADAGEIKPTCAELKEVLTKLKSKGIKLAAVMTDNEEITHKCLKKIGVEGLSDAVYTDNGSFPVKPDPYCAVEFCKAFDVAPEHTIMVGDTLTDAKFAKNTGIAMIGIAKTASNEAVLAPHADKVIHDLSALLTLTE